jgi:hypothetical protein
MSFKGDVKPIYIASNSTNAVAFTGRTRLRGMVIQSTGSSGSLIVNGLANATTVSSSTNTQVYFQVYLAANQNQTIVIPEDGILYGSNNAVGCVDGVGITGNSSALSATLFIDK